VDGALSGVSGAALSGPGRDGPAGGEAAAGAGPDPADEAPDGGGGDRALTQGARVGFWERRLRAAHHCTPDTLGTFLTRLVADKRAAFPTDDAQLYAVGMRATLVALGNTTEAGGYSIHDETQALVILLTDRWLR
jgi:hypothetical protein